MMICPVTEAESATKPGVARRPRLGFLGAGWIGRNRMEAVAQTDLTEIVAIADPVADSARQAAQTVPGAEVCESLEQLLAAGMDGVVIATPNAFHAEQAIQALESGAAVFCQKPLGRNAREAQAVIEAARQADRLLGVDFSYRQVTEIRRVYEVARAGELGEIFAAELVFHNAYGPDKPWYYDWQRSGGGCVIDLGVHLVDLALWMLKPARVTGVTSRLFARGRPLPLLRQSVEDYAVARLDLSSGAAVELACSWNLHAGCDAVISGVFHGTEGGARFMNVNGSFYYFKAERFHRTKCEPLAATTEPWGGRAVTEWARRLAAGAKFDPAIEEVRPVAETLDAIYDRRS